LGIPGATKGDEDPWEFLLREFVVNGSTLDVRGKELKSISPMLWEKYPNIQILDLSQNQIEIPEEFGRLEGLKTLRLQQCGLKSLPVSILGLKSL
jgi:Leucine-rich repeat (LRR) protein